MSFDWNAELREQLNFYWGAQLGPRLRGLTDGEYFWEPVHGMWSVRRSGAANQFRNDFAVPPPDPEPVTTIAWRLHHLSAVLELSMVQVGGSEVAWTETEPPAPRAQEAVDRLDGLIARFQNGLKTLGTEGLTRPARTEFTREAGLTVMGTVLHNYREVMHHGAEIALLRDMYRAHYSSA